MIRIKKTNKYGNRKIEFNGIVFDSKKEAERYKFLSILKDNGIITDLTVHPMFELIPAITESKEVVLKTKTRIDTRIVQRAITYSADFSYYHNGEYVVEDVKPSPKMLPNEFKLKRKLMFWKYRIDVKLIYKTNEAI